MVQVTLTGTSGMLPLKNRFMVGAYIEYNGHAILIDCGEACQIALRKFDLKMSKIDAIFITHEHADHILGIPGLLLSMGNGERVAPVDIFYPVSAEKQIQGLMACIPGLPFKVNFRKLAINSPCSFTYDTIDKMLTVSTFVLRHSVPCLGYKFEFNKLPEFQPAKAKELGIPVQFYKLLHSGQAVQLPDGRTITPDQVLGPVRKATTIVNITDTLAFPELKLFAKGADLLICEGMYGDESMLADMNKKGHMLMQDAARLAYMSGVKNLFLTHYSPANTNPKFYAKQLKSIFSNTTISSDGSSIELK